MKKPFLKQEDDIDWFVSRKPIEKYLKIDRIDNQTTSKFVSIKSDEHLSRKKTKQILKHQIG